MLFKTVQVASLSSGKQRASGVELFQVQRLTPTRSYQPSEDLKQAIKQASPEVIAVFKEVMSRHES